MTTEQPERQAHEARFWTHADPLIVDPRITRSTMMGFPCLRFDDAFFASFDRASGALIVKLPAERVNQVIAAGQGHPFAPAGRTFREWVAIPLTDELAWPDFLAEARTFAEGTGN